MTVVVGMVATVAVPAYARTDLPGFTPGAPRGGQSLAVGEVAADAVSSDEYAAHTLSSTLASTTGSAVASEAQALARKIMEAAAQGRIATTTPSHLVEIGYLAQGRAVPGCGVDYRVLQTVDVALTLFHTVGISDINRRCLGQLAGAGVASAHYADGGGHAIDFFQFDGHVLNGGDPYSLRFLRGLDGVVPSGSNTGQVNCRAGLRLAHLHQFADTCNHVHVDFAGAAADSLLREG